MTPAARAQYLQQLGIIAYVPRDFSSPASFEMSSASCESASPLLPAASCSIATSSSTAASSRKKPADDLLKNAEHPQVFIRDPAAMPSHAQMHLVGTPNAPHTKLIFLLQSATLDWTTPTLQFLKKIIDAVQLPENAIAICFSATTPFQLPEINKSAKIVAFGSGLTVFLPQGSLETVTLTELQHNDAAKRALWQELKAIKAAYGR